MQRNFMPEDTKAGIVQGFLDRFKGEYVCSSLILAEAFFENVSDIKQWQIKEINEIMNKEITGWEKYGHHRYERYGPQRSWVRKKEPEARQMTMADVSADDGFQEMPDDTETPFD